MIRVMAAILMGLVPAEHASPRAAAGAPAPAVLRQDPVELSRPWMERAPVWSSKYYAIKSDLPKEELREYAAHLDSTFEAYRKRLSSLRQNLPASFNVMLFAKRSDYE